MWVLIILSVLIVFWILTKERHVWLLKYGDFKESYHVEVNGHKYYIEEIHFKKYNQALSKFYAVVEEFSKYGKVVNMHYDLYDWSYSTLQFEDCLIDLRYFRNAQNIRLIKSLEPLSIEEYEKDDTLSHFDIRDKKISS